MPNETAVDNPWAQNVGTHRFQFEPPDLFIIHVDGEIIPEHIAFFAELLRRAPATFYTIAYTAKMSSVASGAKRKIGELPRAAGVAYIGASRQMRLVLSLMDKVFTMLSLGKSSPITFVDSEEEGRQWVADLRRKAHPEGPP